MVTLDEVSGLIPKTPAYVHPVFPSCLPLRCVADLPITSDADRPALERVDHVYTSLHSFKLDKQRSYKQQYGDMYFLRLAKIKPAVEEVATASWDGTVIGGEQVKRVDRVLDVRQGDLCWVAGTVYMHMPLKPNILEDVSKDVSLNNYIYAYNGASCGGVHS